MNKRLFGGLIVAGALTLWSSVGVLAEDAEALHGPGSAEASAAIASLATNPDCNPDLAPLATLTTKDPERAKELISGLKEKIAEVKADTTEQILTALENYQERLFESRDREEEDGVRTTTPKLPDFGALATAACSQIQGLFTQTKNAIQNLPAPSGDRERDNETDNERDTQASSTHERD